MWRWPAGFLARVGDLRASDLTLRIRFLLPRSERAAAPDRRVRGKIPDLRSLPRPHNPPVGSDLARFSDGGNPGAEGPVQLRSAGDFEPLLARSWEAVPSRHHGER